MSGFKNTGLFATLQSLGTSEQVEQGMTLALSNIEPEILEALQSLTKSIDVCRRHIKMIRACDFLIADVPSTVTDILYLTLEQLTNEEVDELIDEFGDNEIGVAISRARNVKYGMQPSLNALKRKHGRHVIITFKDDLFDDPEYVYVVEPECYTQDEPSNQCWWNDDQGVTFRPRRHWQRVKSISMFSERKTTLVLSHKHLNLQSVRADEVCITSDQPSLKGILTDDLFGSLTGVPNIISIVSMTEEGAGVWSDGRDLSREQLMEQFPLLKVCVCDHPVYADPLLRVSKEERRLPIEMFSSHIMKEESDHKVYVGCEMYISDLCKTESYFYGCTFHLRGMINPTIEDVKKWLPNATVV